MPNFVKYTPHESDPGWSVAEDDQGQEHVVLTSYAEENYTPPAPTFDAVTGAPIEPMTPGEMGAAPAYADPEMTAMGLTPGTEQPQPDLLANVRETSGAQPPGSGDHGGLVPGPLGTAATPRIDPMAEIVSEGTAAGMGPFAETEGTASEEVEYAVPADELMGEAKDVFGQKASAEYEAAVDEYTGRQTLAVAEADFAEQEAARVQEEHRKAELLVQEQQAIVKAVEDTPIEEDYFAGSPGRQVAAWIALALSGFLQGATRGANPALNQMMTALGAAQDRFIRDQRADKASKLNRRIEVLKDAELAERTMRMQIPAVLAKRAQADASLSALADMPPALTTYLAKAEVERLEHTKAIADRVTKRVESRMAEERRATPATGPVRRGDVELKRLGVSPEAHERAITKENMGGAVAGAERLQTIGQALKAIADANGGSLPAQETISWRTLGLSGLGARLGFDEAKEEVTVRQLLEEAKLAFKQTINIKSVDSENEGKNFNAIMDTGEGETTLNAILARAKQANAEALSIASAYSRDAQGYLEFVRGSMTNNPGVEKRGFRERPVGQNVSKPDKSEDTLSPPAGGGATPPLAAGTARALATSTTGSRPGSYQRLRFRKPAVRP